MKRHLVTVVILLVAVVLYVLGLSGLGAAALVAGVIFELWFWIRLIGRRHPQNAPDASHPTPIKSPCSCKVPACFERGLRVAADRVT